MGKIDILNSTEAEFNKWWKQAKAVTGLSTSKSQFLDFLLSLYREHVKKTQEVICRNCNHKSSVMVEEKPDVKRIWIVCTMVEVKRFTEHGDTWFSAVREIKNTGIQPKWCPLRKGE